MKILQLRKIQKNVKPQKNMRRTSNLLYNFWVKNLTPKNSFSSFYSIHKKSTVISLLHTRFKKWL
jgi:phosphorylcholine metabolism protein LicD